MTTETPRLASLRKKLKAREGKKEYEDNCNEIRKEIARLTPNTPEASDATD